MGVQDVVNNIVNNVSDFVHGGKDSIGAQDGSGKNIQGRLAELKSACETAIQRDQTEAAIHWTASLAAGPITSAITAARIAFDSKAGNLTSQLHDEVNLLCAAVNAKITPHLGVPNTLRADAEHWSGLASRVKNVKDKASVLIGVEGWDDKASPEYSKAAQVQVNALDSLSTIMSEVGVSCQQALSLNLAGFREVEASLLQATNRIRGSGSGGGAFYQRTAAAIVTVVTLRSVVDPEFLKAVRASITIDAHATEVLSSTDLPASYWPGGNAPTGINA